MLCRYLHNSQNDVSTNDARSLKNTREADPQGKILRRRDNVELESPRKAVLARCLQKYNAEDAKEL